MTKKIRVCIAVDELGRYNACGWEDIRGAVDEARAAELAAAPWLTGAVNVVWVEAEVPYGAVAAKLA